MSNLEISKITKEYWTDKDLAELEKLESLREMSEYAIRVISRMPEPVIQVCGPISTGGLGSTEANLNALNEVIKKMQAQGKSVFDQVPFEIPIKKLKSKLKPGEYLGSILTDFHLPIFESGKIKALYFMKGWESSKGSNWEHDEAKRLGIEIFYL